MDATVQAPAAEAISVAYDAEVAVTYAHVEYVAAEPRYCAQRVLRIGRSSISAVPNPQIAGIPSLTVAGNMSAAVLYSSIGVRRGAVR